MPKVIATITLDYGDDAPIADVADLDLALVAEQLATAVVRGSYTVVVEEDAPADLTADEAEEKAAADNVEQCRHYLATETVWRVEAAHSIGQMDRVTWYETTATETAEEIAAAWRAPVVSIRRADEDDAAEMAEGMEV